MRLLVVEDENALAAFLRKGMEEENYAVDVANDGVLADTMLRQCDYDLLLLDLNLPRRDGMTVLSEIRPDKPLLPVLVLTSRNRIEDRVQALDAGADDYLLKPFSFAELSARVRALLRRGRQPVQTVLQVGDLVLNRLEHKIERAGKRIDLTSKEFSLLEYLMRNQGRRVTRSMIIQHVWDISFDSGTNVVDVYVNYLRKKVDAGFERRLIHTVRGVGYTICDGVNAW